MSQTSPTRLRERHVSFHWQDGDDVASLVELHSEASTFVQQMAAGTLTIVSRMRFAEPSETLIFLDWDDTLFPTTEIFDRWGISSRKERWGEIRFTAEQERDLLRWQDMLRRYLTIVCSLSDRIIILTNSRRPWVEDCIEQFAPKVKDFLNDESSRIRVVYAREALMENRRSRRHSIGSETLHCESHLTQEEHDENQTKSKIIAMRKEVRAFYSQYPNQSWKNIMSIGDQRYEHDAVQEVTFQRDSPPRERVRTKAMISPAEPSIAHLTYSLDARCHLSPACVHFDGDIDMDFNSCGDLIGDRIKLVADSLGLAARPGIEVPQEVCNTSIHHIKEELHNEALGLPNFRKRFSI